MKRLKKYVPALLALGLSLCLLSGCGASAGGSAAAGAEEPAELRVAALKGPTGMGLAKLMSQVDGGEETAQRYTVTLAASADEITPLLIKGELDLACVPANLASILHQQTKGEIVTLAINTLGVLYIVECGQSVQSLADLKGKTIVAAGKGSTPEYALRYLLEENGLNPEEDVNIQWRSEHSECVAAMAAGTADIALLPQPFVSAAENKLAGLRIALDLTQQWDALGNGSTLLTGVIVARKPVTEAVPAAVDEFLQEYAASIEWVNANPAEAAKLIGGYGIVDAAVAEAAIPYCNMVCLTGEEMREKLSGYLEVLFHQNPKAIGGALPDDGFYYGA